MHPTVFALCAALGCAISVQTINAQSAIGTWRDYLNYTRAVDVDELGGKVYVASSNGIFTFNRQDNSLGKINKINGLSDIGVVLIRAYEERNLMLIGYQNGNIDLIRGNSINNFQDIRNSTITGNKSIRHVSFMGDFAFLSTGIGIIRFDVERVEVKDFYTVVPAANLSFNETAIDGNMIYAATSQGLYHADINSDLSIFDNWQPDLSMPGPFGNVRNCVAAGGNVFVNLPNASPAGLWVKSQSGVWTHLLESDQLTALRLTSAGLLVSQFNYMEVKDPVSFSTTRVVSTYGSAAPNITRASATPDGAIWLADFTKGLVRVSPQNAVEFIAPDGPATNNSFSLSLRNRELWVASGSPQRPGLWSNSFLWEGFYAYRNGTWNNFTRESLPIIQDRLFVDIPLVYPDPIRSSRVWVGSWFSGLIELENDAVHNYYSVDNSTLRERVEFVRSDGEPYVAVTGMTTDRNGNTWMVNGYSPFPLSVRKADETWVGFPLNNTVTISSALVHLIINREGHKWMIRNNSGIVVFDDGGTIDNPADDKVKLLTAQTGSGGLPANQVYAMTEDLEGQIWVGTADGIAVFFSPFDIFTDNPSDARQILVQQDGIFQYLFEGQPVSAIAVDGANRKWVGTFGSGLFLMSADGTEQILRLNVENSPLLSNTVRDIKIDPVSGEVFIATEEGLISYMGDAIQGRSVNECSRVYPNPVRETYTGPIAIDGLVRDAEVRITDVRGNLISSVTSTGGKAVWDGRNTNNERVPTGVYFALSSNSDGSSTCVSKIMVIK